jgi:hypothetical protein
MEAMMGRKNYYKVLKDELNRANSQPIQGDKTRGQLEVEIAEITAALRGPLNNAVRIGLVAERQQLRRELAALAE